VLSDAYTSVFEAKDRLLQIVTFAQRLGFRAASATTIVDRASGETESHWVRGIPPKYASTFQDVSVARHDPVSQHCKRASIPIL
jgi:hypothetical protein